MEKIFVKVTARAGEELHVDLGVIDAIEQVIETRGGHWLTNKDGSLKVIGSTLLLSSGAQLRVKETAEQILDDGQRLANRNHLEATL